MIPKFHIVIPARHASVRLPGKPLAMIAGSPLIEYVYRCARRAQPESVILATDDERIERAALAFGAEVVMTSPDHESGSDRIAEVARIKGWTDDTLVVNLQGDEPLMPPACLVQVAQILSDQPGADAASLYRPIGNPAELDDPNIVKVVVDEEGMALGFNRTVIPFDNISTTGKSTLVPSWKRHVGLYAYKVKTLHRFTRTDPGPLELKEKLEQLRILAWGGGIVMAEAVDVIPAGVDTEEDLARIRNIIVG
jgi:3-deoxy-manno-octulosonate cytidylyltransferase (CMP-KDO synthetase)